MAGFLQRLFGKPAAADGAHDGSTPAEPERTFLRAVEEMRLKTEAHAGLWGLGDGGQWDADLNAGTIVFTTPRGWRVTAPVQVIGTLNTADGTWLWGWDHPSVPEPLRDHARRAQQFGAQHGLERFTTRMIEASPDDGWTFTSVACHLADAQGGYRGPAGDALVYMTFGTVSIVKGDDVEDSVSGAS